VDEVVGDQGVGVAAGDGDAPVTRGAAVADDAVALDVDCRVLVVAAQERDGLPPGRDRCYLIPTPLARSLIGAHSRLRSHDLDAAHTEASPETERVIALTSVPGTGSGTGS